MKRLKEGDGGGDRPSDAEMGEPMAEYRPEDTPAAELGLIHKWFADDPSSSR